MPTGSEAFLELPIALGYGPATGPTLKTALCHIRTLVGRRINTALWVVHGMPTGSETFLELPIALGFGPATGPTLKTALCHIRTLVGRSINTALGSPCLLNSEMT